jgi:hypothetical protein
VKQFIADPFGNGFESYTAIAVWRVLPEVSAMSVISAAGVNWYQTVLPMEQGVGSLASVVAFTLLNGPSVKGRLVMTLRFAKLSFCGPGCGVGVGLRVGHAWGPPGVQVGVGVTVGEGVGVAVGVAVRVVVGVGVGHWLVPDGVQLTVAVGVDVGVAVGVRVAVDVDVDVAVGVGVRVGEGVGVHPGQAVWDGVAVGVRVDVDVPVEVGVDVGVRVGVTVPVAVGVAVRVGDGVADWVGVALVVGVGVGVRVGVAVGVGIGVAVTVAVSVGVGVPAGGVPGSMQQLRDSRLSVSSSSSSARALKQVIDMSWPGPQEPASSAWTSATATTVQVWPAAAAALAHVNVWLEWTTVCLSLSVSSKTTVLMIRPEGVQPNGLAGPPGGIMSA